MLVGSTLLLAALTQNAPRGRKALVAALWLLVVIELAAAGYYLSLIIVIASRIIG